MSIITTLEQRADLLGSGADNFFRYVDNDETEVASGGDVESPYGFATLREITADHIATWTEHAGFGKNRLTPGWYIDVRGSDGTIWAFDFRGSGTMPEENARAAFESYMEAYRDWYVDNEGI